MTLHTIIMRDNQIQHVMPESAFINLKDTKDADKTFKVLLKSRKWIDDQLQAQIDFGNVEALKDCREIDQRVYEITQDGPVIKAQIQRALNLGYHTVRDSLYRLNARNLVERVDVHGWRAKS